MISHRLDIFFAKPISKPIYKEHLQVNNKMIKTFF